MSLDIPPQRLNHGQMNDPPETAEGFTLAPPDSIVLQYQDDNAVPFDQIPTDLPTGHDEPGNRYRTGAGDWHTENPLAFATFERSAHDFFANSYTLGTNQQAFQVVGRSPGRKAVTLYVPSTLYASGGTTSTPVGVMVSDDEGKAQASDGVQLITGASLTIATEAEVWVGLLPGQTTGFVCVVAEVNLPGGAIGAQ